ncbi:MAG: primosomal protein N' [Pseudomonadota bacterium]|nr:primosomal protein N' [Pseudomonadota bacterium]
MFVKVAFPIPTEQVFDYAVPAPLAAAVAVGKRVRAPFGGKTQTGCIVAVAATADVENPKEIMEIVEARPLFGPRELAFYRWIAAYYLYPLGKALHEILPGGKNIRSKTEKTARRMPTSAVPTLTPRQRLVLEALPEAGESDGISLAALRRDLGDVRTVVAALAKKGLVEIGERETFRPLPRRREVGPKADRPVLNAGQEAALREIVTSLRRGHFQTFLLHGVTGSGKTEVYLRAMEETRQGGGGAIYLVPEISLTPRLLARLEERFGGDNIAVLHSGVSRAVRYDQWRLLESGRLSIAVGARSALFAPVRNLKLIVVDEEHDASYKQDERLPYHARDMAIVRGRLEGATVLLGSATPALQTYFNATRGKVSLLVMPKRIADRPLPAVEIVDMAMEKALREGEAGAVLSRRLLAAIAATLQRRQQALLLLNRRGYHTFLVCRDCGRPLRCRNCEVSLIHHADDNRWKCHYCDYSVTGQSVCSHCKSPRIVAYGMGTERLEDEIRARFPAARVRRMDSDTMDRQGAHEELLQALGAEEIDILVGTQMIAKGHDFPNVTLVGVVMADSALNLPDFRAAERTFQLLTQVSGRGGRGDHPGQVIIQTFNPGHYALQRAKDHDYEGFYREETRLRRGLSYPPYARLIQLTLSCPRQAEGEKAAAALAALARELLGGSGERGGTTVAGPVEAPLARLRGRYRWQILLKGDGSRAVRGLARELMARFRVPGVRVKVDVDPVYFM